MSYLPLEILTPIIAATAISLIKALLEKVSDKKKETKLEEAEKQAFSGLPEAILEKMEKIDVSQAGLEFKTKELCELIDTSKQALQQGNLFNLYNRQIERYQDETRSRASWSFYIALIAMFAGFAFIFWGGQHILSQTSLDHLAAGSLIAAIGGSVSAYITKTFLDIHKVSLQQLNRYFAQPVINDHILMAQRLSDCLENQEAKQMGYQSIIASITALIHQKGQERVEEHKAQTAEPRKRPTGSSKQGTGP